MNEPPKTYRLIVTPLELLPGDRTRIVIRPSREIVEIEVIAIAPRLRDLAVEVFAQRLDHGGTQVYDLPSGFECHVDRPVRTGATDDGA